MEDALNECIHIVAVEVYHDLTVQDEGTEDREVSDGQSNPASYCDCR